MFLRARQPFKLDITWLQGQAFRWEQRGDWYYGFVGGALIRVRNLDDGLDFESDVPEESLKPQVERYFRLDQDIGQVHDALRGRDDEGTMDGLIHEHGGMRILRQNPWECLVAYICSQNNGVPGIKKIVDSIANKYGTRLSMGGVPLHAFPPPQRLAAVSPETLKKLAPGLNRAERIREVATHITEGSLDLVALARMPHPHARAVLMSYADIGEKIADCVSLFSLDRPEAFPIDANIGKGLKKHYGKTYSTSGANSGLMQWVGETFGENAGYAGQLLFLDQLKKSNAKRA